MKFFFSKRSSPAPLPEQPVNADAAPAAAADHQDEIASVIALALHLYIRQVREYENAVITIQKVMKPYSPWSSKIYGMRQTVTHTPAVKPRLK